ncbi:hypothetical protein SAMN04488048_10527 [Trichococcus flocculiformis]|nr:Hypothetical protein TES5_870 [Trichococcus sp. ES5]SHF47064.1 hypothetical protein SAMN04488048_10527 [Trichococcus flocculiformis]
MLDLSRFFLRINNRKKCNFVRFSGSLLVSIGDYPYGRLTKAKIICIVLLLFVNGNKSC